MTDLIRGPIRASIPENPIKEPLFVEKFFDDDTMFTRVATKVNSVSWGPGGSHKYSTTMGRWEHSGIAFDADIEAYCLDKVRKMCGNQDLGKTYFFAARYQIQDGCIPNLWDHYDQNGTQVTVDITITNSANWALRVNGRDYYKTPNQAVAFSGQLHEHARPPYPTSTDESVYCTVLFLHYATSDHWIRQLSDGSGLSKFGNDGNFRYFNKHRYMPIPDPPVGQVIDSSHDYDNMMNNYDILSRQEGAFDAPVEITPMPIIDKKIHAPGIVEYTFPREAGVQLTGLVHNHCFRLWEQAQVLSDARKSVYNENSRKCYVRTVSSRQLGCHPIDPGHRVYASLEAGVMPMIEDYRKLYSIKELDSDRWNLLRYDHTNMFHNHYDDCLEFPRVVAVSVILNDAYEGGELVFQHHNLTIGSKAGSVVVFSGSYPFMHRVNPVKIGTRYAAVKWFNWQGGSRAGI
jgi:hypothetical protein